MRVCQLLALLACARAACVFLLQHQGADTHKPWEGALSVAVGSGDAVLTRWHRHRADGLPAAVATCPPHRPLIAVIEGPFDAGAAVFVHEVRRLAWTARRAPPAAILVTDNTTHAPTVPILGVDARIVFDMTAAGEAWARAEDAASPYHRIVNVVVPASPRVAADGTVTWMHKEHWQAIYDVGVIMGVAPPSPPTNVPKATILSNAAPAPPVAPRVRVGIIYYRPDTVDVEEFEGGFVSALWQLHSAGVYYVTWINIRQGGYPPDTDLDKDFDVLLMKSNWGWGVDTAFRAYMAQVWLGVEGER